MDEMTLEYALRIGTALLIGTAVGLERELQGKPAGLRTNILMCVGSCIIMIISLQIAENTTKIADPGRIAAQVVTGVGFLCAGTIMRSKFSISGLTTAATIWVLSALGLAAGAGYYVLALLGTAIITVVLILVRHLEGMIIRHRTTFRIQVEMDKDSDAPKLIKELIREKKIPREEMEYNYAEDRFIAIFEYTASKKEIDRFIKVVSETPGVTSVLTH